MALRETVEAEGVVQATTPGVAVVRVGLVGAGNVGGALFELLEREGDAVAARTGLRFQVVRVAVSDVSRARPVDIPASILTTDALAIASAEDVDVVVELMGGLEPARSVVIQALRNHKPVVTANKELISSEAAALYAEAARSGVDLLFEASVGGAIPLVRPLRESLAGERVTRVMGIVNGTTNYILTRMSEDGVSYADAVKEAQSLGFAERDPTADVAGHDAAAKAAILATLAFGAEISQSDVWREGIANLRQEDVAHAARLGYEVKLLAIAERGTGPSESSPEALDGNVSVRVHPAMVPRSHPLAAVRRAHNAVFIEGDSVGELMLYGRGAGGAPTAAAVLGDLIDASHNLLSGTCSRLAVGPRISPQPAGELWSAFYVSIDVMDRPGVLATVAGVFGEHDVSIRSMEQMGLGEEARLVFLTHSAKEANMAETLESLAALDSVKRVGALLRVLGEVGDGA